MPDVAQNADTVRSVLPLDPHFLSLSEEYQNFEIRDDLNEDRKKELRRNYYPNIHGLFDTTFIREFLAVMSSDLGVFSQMPLFQLIPPKDEFHFVQNTDCDRGMSEIDPFPDHFYDEILKRKEGTMRLVRIDARSFFKGNPYCELCKKCFEEKGEHPCRENDSRVLLLFHPALEKHHFNREFDGYYEELKEICRLYSGSRVSDGVNYAAQSSEVIPEKMKNHQRVYLKYTCTLSGFTEYAFPLYHNGHIIAAVMMGQRVPYGLDEKSFFSSILKQEPKLKKQFSHIRKIGKNKYRDFVRAVDSDTARRVFCREYFTDLNDTQLEEIFKKLSVLEKRIDSEVDKRTREIVSAKFDSIEKEFREGLRTNNVKDAYDYNSLGGIISSYKETLSASLNRICREFDTKGEIYVYSKQQKIGATDNSKVFTLIGKSLDESEIPGRISFGSMVEVSRLPEEKIAKYANPCMYLKQYEQVYLINDYSEDFLIIIREFFSWRDDYPEQFRVVEKHLHPLYHTIIEPYNVLQATSLSKNLETSMRITVHEASNVIPTVTDTIYRELGLDSQKENTYIGSPYRISENDRPLWDVYQRLKALDNVYKRSTIPFKDIIPRVEYYDLHRLVYSVKTLFDEKAGERFERIDVDMDEVYNRVRILTDDGLFTHIFFNLLDNAVKYGYMGSNICIRVFSENESEVRLNSDKVRSVRISVSSYGEQITYEEMEGITELFKRANKSEGVEGMGVGLFIVKKMCVALGYGLDIGSEWVSDQNIPAHYWYMVQNPVKRGEGDVKRFLEDTISDTEVSLVVNTRMRPDEQWKIGFHEMSSIIVNPTYKNTFTVTLKSTYKYRSLLTNNNK